MSPSLSDFLLLALLLLFSQAIECFRALTALPVLYHCQDLIDAIVYLARQPGEDDVKAWGRRLPSTLYTQKVPKLYHILGPVIQTTCAVKVDVDRDDFLASDDFRQSDVARSAGMVVSGCLRARRLVGLDYPGEGGHVYAMIIRADGPWGLETAGGYEVRNVSLPNTNNVLRIVEGNIAAYEDRLIRGNTSSIRVDDQ